jgi:hypothetical protein
MKTLRRLSVALVFALTLTVPALAGDIETGKTKSPSTPTTTTTEGQMGTPSLAGDMQNGVSEATAGGSAAEVALNLLQSMLALF